MEKPTQPIHTIVEEILDQVRGALRFRWIALIVAWCAALVLWIGIFLIPNTYESSAQVFVDTQTTLSEATHGLSIGDDIQGQIEQVSQALLGGPQLKRVAEETNLMAGALTDKQQEEVIDGLRKNIEITGKLANPHSTTALFTITYQDHNLARSTQVVDHLLNDFVEGSLGGKQKGSQQAEEFLTGQIADYGQRLSASEQRLADFKRRNVGLLPGDQGDYFSRLQKENDDLSQARESLALAVRKRDQLAEQLKKGQQFTAGSPDTADSTAGDTEDQIAKTQERLNQLLLKYTDKYPDVIAARQTLQMLKAREQAELEAAKKGSVSAATALHLSANPVYQKLQEQYNDEQVQIASMQQDIADREKRIENLKASLGSAPQVQAEYAQLTRDYDVTKKQYDELLQRLDSARLGQQAANTGMVKFDIVNPPTPQYTPVEPNRPLLIIGALVLALAMGFGTAYVLHMLQPVFVSARQLGSITGLTVLGSVGLAWMEQYRAERRKRRVVYVWGTAALLVLAIGVLLLQGYISNFLTELHV
jgi:polysaccharide chain length determinant protein (PEP-CTERM system associated)